MCVYEQVQTSSARKSGEGNITTKGFRVKEVHDQSYTAIRYICYAKKKKHWKQKDLHISISTLYVHTKQNPKLVQLSGKADSLWPKQSLSLAHTGTLFNLSRSQDWLYYMETGGLQGTYPYVLFIQTNEHHHILAWGREGGFLLYL